MIRIATALFLKSLYDSECVAFDELLSVFMAKFATLSASGVNSAEFLCIFGYFCQRELSKRRSGISAEQVAEIVRFIASQIGTCNRQLTSHPNLDLYATIQKICSNCTAPKLLQSERPPFFSGLSPKMATGVFGEPLGVAFSSDPRPDDGAGFSKSFGSSFPPPPASLTGIKEAQPQSQYILELDPCAKCF